MWLRGCEGRGLEVLHASCIPRIGTVAETLGVALRMTGMRKGAMKRTGGTGIRAPTQGSKQEKWGPSGGPRPCSPTAGQSRFPHRGLPQQKWED